MRVCKFVGKICCFGLMALALVEGGSAAYYSTQEASVKEQQTAGIVWRVYQNRRERGFPVLRRVFGRRHCGC